MLRRALPDADVHLPGVAKEDVHILGRDHGDSDLLALGRIGPGTGIAGGDVNGGVNVLRALLVAVQAVDGGRDLLRADIAEVLGLCSQPGDDPSHKAHLDIVCLDGDVVIAADVAVEDHKADVGIVGRDLQDGIGIFVAGDEDQVKAHVGVVAEGRDIVGLVNVFRVSCFKIVLLGGFDHAAVAGLVPAAVVDRGVGHVGNFPRCATGSGGAGVGIVSAAGKQAGGEQDGEQK